MVARGIDTQLAAKLRNDGWALGKLKQSSEQDLQALGITDFAIDVISKESRQRSRSRTSRRCCSPIVCCVCRARDRGLIVHHITECHVSHSHEPDNLAVLRSEYHDRAHTVSKLSRNLDAKTVRSLKQAWEHEVSLLDVSAISAASLDNSDAWQ